MKPIIYEKVSIFPIITRDAYEIGYFKRKFLQIKIFNGKIHIKINGLKMFKRIEVDGLDMMFACRDCTIKYGELIKGEKGFLTNHYFCPECYRKV